MNTTKRHSAQPIDKRFSESTCAECGERVVGRANVHGYKVWTHRKEGR